MKPRSWGILAGIAMSGIVAGGSLQPVMAATITLYDGTSNVTPNVYNSPNPYLSFLNLNGGSQTASGNKTTLDTSSANNNYAGYSNYNAPPISDAPLFANALTAKVNSTFPILDPNAGYTLSFTIKINSQVNDGINGANRAGFSAIVLGNDNRGIEIGFRNSDIFSQGNASFNAIGEQTNDPSGIGNLLSNLTTYNLNISGNNYSLTSGGNTLLTGALRDYTSATGFGSGVYKTPNFIFLGDDTTSARANVDISNITLVTNDATAIPEPSNLVGIGIALGFGAALKRKLSKIDRRSNNPNL